MSGVRTSIFIDSVVGITVVRDDDSLITGGFGGLNDVLHALVYGPNSLGYGVVNARMAHHIAVGEVHDNEVILVFFDSCDELILHLVGAHFRLQVVRCHLWRSYQDTIFTLIGGLSATVKEECNIRILLCLCGMELLLAQF